MIRFLMTVFSTVFLGSQIIKEKTEPVAPKGTRFDWEQYYADIENGMPAMEQVRKTSAWRLYDHKTTARAEGSHS